MYHCGDYRITRLLLRYKRGIDVAVKISLAPFGHQGELLLQIRDEPGSTRERPRTGDEADPVLRRATAQPEGLLPAFLQLQWRQPTKKLM